MKIFYKCRCMKAEAVIDVPDRRPEGELMEWMGLVQHAIAVDHKALSPRCMAVAMEYAKIPLEDETQGIGVKPTRN